MSGIINPFNHVHFVKWKKYVESIGGDAFGAVVLREGVKTFRGGGVPRFLGGTDHFHQF